MDTQNQKPATRKQLDAMTYNHYIECNLDAKEVARQIGVTVRTVRARVKREARRRVKSGE